MCKCDLRTKLVGDGCPECNPDRWADTLADEDQDDYPGYDILDSDSDTTKPAGRGSDGNAG